MSAWLERVRAARAASDPAPLLEAIPYARFMGLSAGLVEGELRCSMRFSDHLIGDSSLPALHGGATGALLESVSILTVLWRSETARLPKTINVTVDYLRRGRARDTFAAASLTKAGRRVASVRALAWQVDREAPIAAADAHFLLTPE
ncbi:MAG TPA: PaaI family thioesterase [Sandaracinaceae bacterium LLY-WYZ-13_1]|nr:PaaI family thioesterase [Sandaracinaceae bacterium LLY-WYZ-13_1]